MLLSGEKNSSSLWAARQPSLLHLAKFIQQYYHQLLDTRVAQIYEEHPQNNQTRQDLLTTCAKKMHSLNLETLIGRFLQPVENPSLHNPFVPQEEGMPGLLTLSPQALLARLGSMLSTSRFTLNLSNLTIQDTLELLYLCRGRITPHRSVQFKRRLPRDDRIGLLQREWLCRGSG